jgi:hypothetical protein
MSALSLLAQTDRHKLVLPDGSAQLTRDLPKATVLDARLLGSSKIGSADDNALPDAPSATGPDAPAPEPFGAYAPIERSGPGARPAARGAIIGFDRGVADRKYWALTSAMYSASIADAELTHHCLQQKTCAFLPNALYNRAALYGIGIPADIGVMYLTYCMKGKHSPIWYVPSAFVTAANIYVGAHSYRRLK